MSLTELIRECEDVMNEGGILLDRPSTLQLIACLKLYREALEGAVLVYERRGNHTKDLKHTIWCIWVKAKDALTASEEIASGNGIITPREEE